MIKKDEKGKLEVSLLEIQRPLPVNIIEEYKPYYKGTAKPWQEGMQGFWKEFKRFINI